jgi:C4-type Zn-finger protein
MTAKPILLSSQTANTPAVYPRNETIRCPQCRKVQTATVEFEKWMPFPAYVHTCESCLYTITESEWEVAV